MQNNFAIKSLRTFALAHGQPVLVLAWGTRGKR